MKASLALAASKVLVSNCPRGIKTRKENVCGEKAISFNSQYNDMMTGGAQARLRPSLIPLFPRGRVTRSATNLFLDNLSFFFVVSRIIAYICTMKQREEMDENKIVIYQTEDGQTQIDVRLEKETVWLTQAQMAELFQKDRTVITRHINNVFKEGELEKEQV